MAVNVVKAVQDLGQCNEGGLSFHQADFLTGTRKAFDAAQKIVRERGATTTGPCRVKILVEQDILED